MHSPGKPARPNPRKATKVTLASASILAALALTSCASPVQVDAAPDAANAKCAPTMIALPEKINEEQLRETTSQATAAWGDPSSIIVRCGVNPPPPTTDPCASVNGVDWLINQIEGTNNWRATTYGREPALEVVFNLDKVSSSTVLVDLAQPVAQLPQVAKCLNVQDTTDLQQGTKSK